MDWNNVTDSCITIVVVEEQKSVSNHVALFSVP